MQLTKIEETQATQATSAIKLAEKISDAIASLSSKTTANLSTLENDVTSLIEGKMTVAELTTKYGQLTHTETADLKNQLELVRNSLEVEIEKSKTERLAIKAAKHQALTQLQGLKAAYEIQAATQETIDKENEANYQEKKTAIKEVDRQNDLAFRHQRSRLTAEDNESAIAHQTTVNRLKAKVRESATKGMQARTARLEVKAATQQQRTRSTVGGEN